MHADVLDHATAWRSRLTVGWVMALAVGIAAAGCGGSGRESSVSTPAAAANKTSAGRADACALLTAAEIADAVGNAVNPGRQSSGPANCSWGTEQRDHIDVLLIAHLKGSTREEILCADVRKAAAGGTGVPGIGEAARWVFAKVPFNSGELEVCDAKAYVSLSVTGKGDEATLRAAALALARRALARL